MTSAVEKNILLVDDSRMVRQLVKMFITKHMKCNITEADDGVDALLKLKERSYDLVITDINMPNMNGLSLIRKIRGEMSLDVPVIIVSTLGMEKDRDKGLRMGANSYVTKPIQAPELIRKATDLLS